MFIHLYSGNSIFIEVHYINKRGKNPKKPVHFQGAFFFCLHQIRKLRSVEYLEKVICTRENLIITLGKENFRIWKL